MAKKKVKIPSVIDNGVSREMTAQELEAYGAVNSEARDVINARIEEIKKREAAIAKMAALGLTESDLKAMGL